jgi:hypothetical protein
MFEQRRVELGYPPVRLGATTNEVLAALEALGASVQTRKFHTITHIQYKETLEYYEQRVFSSMWKNLPDVVHRQIMQELRRFIKSEFRSPDSEEPVKITAELYYVKFD